MIVHIVEVENDKLYNCVFILRAMRINVLV